MTTPKFEFLSAIKSHSNSLLFVVDEIHGLQIVKIVADPKYNNTESEYILQTDLMAIQIVCPLVIEKFNTNIDQIESTDSDMFILSEGQIWIMSHQKFFKISFPVVIDKFFLHDDTNYLFAIGADDNLYRCSINNEFSVKLSNINIGISDISFSDSTLVDIRDLIHKFRIIDNDIVIVETVGLLENIFGQQHRVYRNFDNGYIFIDMTGVVYFKIGHHCIKIPVSANEIVVDFYICGNIVVFQLSNHTVKFMYYNMLVREFSDIIAITTNPPPITKIFDDLLDIPVYNMQNYHVKRAIN